MGINLLQPILSQLQLNFKLKWNSSVLTYLGTLIPSNISKILELNVPPLLKRVRALLDKWNTRLHLWFGCCNILKMSMLSKFLYLLQALPIYIPSHYFKLIQRVFFEFIWAHKHPRLKRDQLTLPKQYGVLAVPEVCKYYQAVHLSRLIDWNGHQDIKLWVQLEQAQSAISLCRASWCYNALPRDVKNHPLIG